MYKNLHRLSVLLLSLSLVEMSVWRASTALVGILHHLILPLLLHPLLVELLLIQVDSGLGFLRLVVITAAARVTAVLFVPRDVAKFKRLD